MKLVNKPTDFSPAYSVCAFSFDEVDPQVPSEVAFWVEGDELPVGVKRYVGRTAIEASPTSYLMRLCQPRPLSSVACSFVYPEERNKRVSVKWGEQFEYATPAVLFVASKERLEPLSVIDADSAERVIGRDEQDEVGIVVPADTRMDMVLRLSTGESLTLTADSGSQAGLWLLCLNFGWILERLPNPAEVDSARLEVKLAGEVRGVVNYRVVERDGGAVRLAWLTPSGTIAYHTFPALLERRTSTKRSAACSVEGVAVGSLCGCQSLRLRTGALPNDKLKRLVQLVQSPAIWIVEPDGHCRAVALEKGEVVEAGNDSDVALLITPHDSHVVW